VYVDVEYLSPHLRGYTVADWHGKRQVQTRATVCVAVDSPRFLELYRQRIATIR
jgi:inosine-uridine nucleoside N-ribohydrolase